MSGDLNNKQLVRFKKATFFRDAFVDVESADFRFSFFFQKIFSFPRVCPGEPEER